MTCFLLYRALEKAGGSLLFFLLYRALEKAREFLILCVCIIAGGIIQLSFFIIFDAFCLRWNVIGPLIS